MKRSQTEKKPRLSRKAFLALIIIFLFLTFFTTATLADSNTIIVDTGVLNVRLGPGMAYDVMEQVEQGQEYQVLEEQNEWYKIRVDHDRIGWVASWLVDNPDPGLNDGAKYGVVNAPELNVRQSNSLDAEVIGRVPQGTELEIVYQNGEWTQVVYMGTLAWAHSDYLDIQEGALNPEMQPQEPQAVGPTVPISESVIVLDAGHGGVDPGAVASDDLYEKNLTLETTLRVSNRLQDFGATVILTRSDDSSVSLNDRAYLSNAYSADAFISLHYDSTEIPNLRSGTATYFYGAEDQLLAESINNQLSNMNLLPNSGAHFGDYLVIRDNYQPSVLLELGFLNNDNDLEVVTTEAYQSAVTEAIVQGLVDYFGQ